MSTEYEMIEYHTEIDPILPMIEDNDETLNSDAQTSGTCLEEPYLNMEFESIDDAWELYNIYARREGFSIRKNSTYRSKKDNRLLAKEFVCYKEGHKVNNNATNKGRPIERTGCKAKLQVRMGENGKWRVSVFEKEHNHELVTPNKSYLLRSHRRIIDVKKNLLKIYGDAGVPIKCMMNVLRNESGGTSNIGCIEKDIRNYLAQGKLNSKGIDGQLVLNYFRSKQAEDPSFFYALQLDEFQILRNIFWVDSRSRNAYKCFGDVVTFDTTYKTNNLDMPFAPFTGVNHHRHSILFGSALLEGEGESTFIWLFETWLEAMSNKHPVSIITDQDKAMKAAIAKVFPNTRHALCKWHILRKVPEKLGFIMRKDSSFDWKFKSCINDSITIDEFEECWQILLDQYGLQDNDWLQSLYDVRHQWVPAFLRDTFFGNMSTTQRSESMNAYFDGFVHSNTNLKDFVVQYEKALQYKYERELHADLLSTNTTPILKTPLPIEEEGAEIYTRKNFVIFQQEILASLVCVLDKEGENDGIKIYRVQKIKEQRHSYIVKLDCSTKKATCGCKKFEFEGFLCQHIIAVFKAKKIFSLPPHYIMKRWTKNAKKGVNLDIYGVDSQDKFNDSPIVRYNILSQLFHECADRGLASLDAFKLLFSTLQEVKIKIDTLVDDVTVEQHNSVVNDIDGNSNTNEGSQVGSSVDLVVVRDPPRKIPKGRPRQATRYKKPYEEPTKRQNTCTYCGTPGHNKSTCKTLKENANVEKSNQGRSYVAGLPSIEENTTAMEYSDQPTSFPFGHPISQEKNAMIGPSDHEFSFTALMERQLVSGNEPICRLATTNSAFKEMPSTKPF